MALLQSVFIAGYAITTYGWIYVVRRRAPLPPPPPPPYIHYSHSHIGSGIVRMLTKGVNEFPNFRSRLTKLIDFQSGGFVL